MAASVSMLLLLVLLHSIAAAAGGGFKKSASPPRLVERWWDASGNGNQQQRGRAVVAKRPSSSQPPPPAFQSVKRCVLQLNNGTRLALAGALAGGFSNREYITIIHKKPPLVCPAYALQSLMSHTMLKKKHSGPLPDRRCQDAAAGRPVLRRRHAHLPGAVRTKRVT